MEQHMAKMNRAENTISVQHVSVSVDKTFEETCARFESRMGHLDYGAFDEQLTCGMSESAARDYMKNIEGPLGLMIFAVIDHGRLAGLAGKASGAKQYVVGNPLFALQMTKKDIRAGLWCAAISTVRRLAVTPFRHQTPNPRPIL